MRETNNLKAIETKYNGYKFRSRLEARYAVCFEALGIRYHYENEGFDLGNGIWYLPDFWLPYHEWWLEIKGAKPTAEEIEKARQLATQSGHHVAILAGNVGDYEIYSFPGGWGDDMTAFEILLMAYARMDGEGISLQYKDMSMPEHFLDRLLDGIEVAYKTAKEERFDE